MKTIDYGYLRSLTSLRFFAAIFVVIHHISLMAGNLGSLKAIGEVGWLGVSFFFTLSGFVLMWSFDAYIAPGRYILRRLARIYPLHFICLFLCLFFYLATGVVLGGYKGTTLGTIANFILFQDWLPGHPEIRQAWNGVSWSLSCEFFFYLIAPFIFRRLIDIGRYEFAPLIVGVWLTGLVVSIVASLDHDEALLDFFVYDPLPRTAEFLLGAVGACWLKAGFRFRSPIYAVTLMALPVLAYQDFITTSLDKAATLDCLFVPGSFLLIIAVAGNEIDGRLSWLNHRRLVQLGDASFALYMTHALLLGLFGIFIKKWFYPQFYVLAPLEWSLVFLYSVTAILVSLLAHVALERPARLRLLKLIETCQPTA